ncbi:Teichoic acid translocation permease protein TagG [Cupriavidus oxalaticus]|nr:Teichoic acid translocation permease protein TagG [Cupriavidus oxalaticus]SPC14283.1 Teichoic acid translocation permease protein TagG [Cupriavidus oxalaticus]
MGLTWSFFNPILMLAVYTFVFSVVFKARWGTGGEETKTQFAIILFVGMNIFGLFAETLNRAPTLVTANANYVKKVIFPLEVLPVVAIGAALFHTLIGVAVLLIALVLMTGSIPATALALPLVMVPLLLLSLGLGWILSSLGVYVRDVAQTVGIATTVIMFLSPVFYSVNALPEGYRKILMLNPLTFIIEQARATVIFGKWPNLPALSLHILGGLVVAWAGYWWFQKTRRGFADVL